MPANTAYSPADYTTTYSRPVLAVGTRDPFRSSVNDFSSYIEVTVSDNSLVNNTDAKFSLTSKSATSTAGGSVFSSAALTGGGEREIVNERGRG